MNDISNSTPPDQTERPPLLTRAARLAAFFHSKPNVWIDGRVLGTIAGVYGWRSRVSDCRRAPFLMRIINRQRNVKTKDGMFVVSEYLFSPEVEEKQESPTHHVSALLPLGWGSEP